MTPRRARPEERLKGLQPEQVLKGLSSAQRAQLRALLDEDAPARPRRRPTHR